MRQAGIQLQSAELSKTNRNFWEAYLPHSLRYHSP